MRLELGSPVRCADGPCGELADVVIDPMTRRVTNLVVQPHNRHDLARLVSVDRVRAGKTADDSISLDCTVTELEQLESVQQSAYLRLGEFPVEDPDWEVGISQILALPYYQGVEAGSLGMGMPPMSYDSHVTEIYDRVPKSEVEIRRASSVYSADEHYLGHVEGFVVDDEQRIGHLVLEHGHLWGKRDVTIPIGAVASIGNDEVKLSLSKDDVGALKAVRVHRWHR